MTTYPTHKSERTPLLTTEQYDTMYAQSIADPDAFWGEQAERLDWYKKWHTVKNTSFEGDVNIKWFEGGTLNVSHNCIDRHLAERGDQTAIIWEPDSPEDTAKHITYQQLHEEVCRFANVLKSLGVTRGDVVTLYMPMIPEAAYAMLACSRIGAIHSVVFGGFSPEALRNRLENCNSHFVITADKGRRGGKDVPLLANVLKAVAPLQNMDVLVVTRDNNPTLHSPSSLHSPLAGESKSEAPTTFGGARDSVGGRDLAKTPHASTAPPKIREGLVSATPPHPPSLRYGETRGGSEEANDQRPTTNDSPNITLHDYHTLHKSAATTCPPAQMDAEDPLFILYTSGSTGKPKGVLHTTAGYLLYASITHKYAFDYQDGDIYWCTADVGWVTGHSYILYGPLANGATTVMFEGVPNYPDNSRCWQIVDKHNINVFYTAPTAIRALMAAGNDPVTKTSRKSLRILGTVGEPINPEAWRWYYEIIGESRCPIIDTWWQTETGGFMLTPMPYAHALKPGSAMKPFFGVQPALVDEKNNLIEGEGQGALCFTDSWPGQMRSVIGDHKRFIATYFSDYKGKYFSGDGAKRDADGDYWITGRMDDVINVSGHRLGTAEVESALVLHESVAEAAVVGYPHDIKGEGIYCYVILNNGVVGDAALHDALIKQVRAEIGPFAKPDHLHFTSGLPKTRSGKIMRRILRKIAANRADEIGDTSTLLNPEIVESLIADRQH